MAHAMGITSEVFVQDNNVEIRKDKLNGETIGYATNGGRNSRFFTGRTMEIREDRLEVGTELTPFNHLPVKITQVDFPIVVLSNEFRTKVWIASYSNPDSDFVLLQETQNLF